jgi:hypothetical protein
MAKGVHSFSPYPSECLKGTRLRRDRLEETKLRSFLSRFAVVARLKSLPVPRSWLSMENLQ